MPQIIAAPGPGNCLVSTQPSEETASNIAAGQDRQGAGLLAPLTSDAPFGPQPADGDTGQQAGVLPAANRAKQGSTRTIAMIWREKAFRTPWTQGWPKRVK
jgi:hypothetical protein